MIVDNHPDPWMALYYMRLKAMRFGTYVDTVQSTDTSTTEQMTDGSTIQLTLDPQSGTWELHRFVQDNGDKITLYHQHGEYEEESEDTGEYTP